MSINGVFLPYHFIPSQLVVDRSLKVNKNGKNGKSCLAKRAMEEIPKINQ
jgi:hypothetical protein